MSLPEHSLSVGGILNSLTGENAYVLMGILGANMMPHNFYLHSSVVQVSNLSYSHAITFCSNVCLTLFSAIAFALFIEHVFD